VLGELFAARPGDVDDQLVEEGPHGRLPFVEAKGLSEVTFATLGEILGIGSYDDLIERTAEGRDAEGGEAGVLSVPDEIRDALAAADDVGTVASRWAATDDLQDWPTADVRQVLAEVRQLASEAQASDRQLWYWWSL
jgi:hypothetical protein